MNDDGPGSPFGDRLRWRQRSGSAVNDVEGLDSRYDPLRTNRSFLMRMEFWRGTSVGA